MYEPPRVELHAQIRWGKVDSVDDSNHRVKVKFSEQDGFVSYDLPVLVPVGGDYALPAADSMVLCMVVEGRLGAGFVLGTFYTDDSAPPLNDKGKRSLVSDDLRLGKSDASDKVALAPAVKNAMTTLKNAISGAGVVAQDGGAAFKANILGALSNWPPDMGAEKVSAK